jgi:hypothetical protein
LAYRNWGPMARIHLPPAASQERNVPLPGSSVQKRVWRRTRWPRDVTYAVALILGIRARTDAQAMASAPSRQGMPSRRSWRIPNSATTLLLQMASEMLVHLEHGHLVLAKDRIRIASTLAA